MIITSMVMLMNIITVMMDFTARRFNDVRRYLCSANGFSILQQASLKTRYVVIPLLQNALLNRNNKQEKETELLSLCSLIMSSSTRHSLNCENQKRRSGPHDFTIFVIPHEGEEKISGS